MYETMAHGGRKQNGDGSATVDRNVARCARLRATRATLSQPAETQPLLPPAHPPRARRTTRFSNCRTAVRRRGYGRSPSAVPSNNSASEASLATRSSFAADAPAALPIHYAMTRRQTFLLCFAIVAASAAAIFLAISVDRGIYAPGAKSVRNAIADHAGVARAQRRLPPVARRWLEPARVLRKTYSVVAFAIVGFFVAPLVRRRNRILGDALVVAGFSAVIEVAQALTGSQEGYAWNAFDVGCGAVGGALGAYAWNAIMRRRPRGDAAR